MKPLLVLARITLVGCLWSIIFIEGVRVIMLESWHFDIFWPPHWLHAWNLWSSGWVIDTPKEWAFILLILAFIPMLLTGWIALSLIPWERLIWKIVSYPVKLIRSISKPIKIVTKQPVIVKKKSYKEIRPTGPRAPIYDYNDSLTTPRPDAGSSVAYTAAPANSVTDKQSTKDKAVAARNTFSHSLFNLDDEDDDFDLDFDSFEKSDIFKIDSSKKKPAETEISEKKDGREAKNGRFDFDDEDDDYYVRETEPKEDNEYKNDHRYDNDDEYKPRRRSYNDEEHRRDNRGAENRSENRRSESRRDRREDRRSNNNEAKNDRRRENNGRDNKNENRKQAKENTAVAQYNNPVADILIQKGYDIISNITIKNTLIDFIGIADDKICLCLIDKEAGDWLADEERFNDEEPLWFSESSHRISPVRKIDLAAQALSDKLESNNDVDFEIKPFVIIQMGNIINAEDMFDVWNDIGVEVTRINRGSPREIKLFSKSLEEADGKVNKNKLDALKKLMRNIA